MSTREAILEQIRAALKVRPQTVSPEEAEEFANPKLPEPPQVWPVTGKSTEEKVKEFEENLKIVSGCLVRCADRKAAEKAIAARIAELSGQDASFELGVMPKDLSLELAEKVQRLRGDSLKRIFAPGNPDLADPKNLATMNASLVTAEALLADTGTAVIRAASAFDRLCCYLAPVCWIAARESTLRENLPHFWSELMPRVQMDKENAARSGEFLFMTGPSRTADIEKILILGVHGPREVIIFSIMNE